MSAAENRPEWGPRDALDVLDKDIPRVDGPAKVSGLARYTHDVRLEGMLYARLVLCPWPRALITRLDGEPARKVPGVVHVALLKGEGDEVLYQGADGAVAVVAGETPEAAAAGVAALAVDYERRAPVVTPEQALAEGAPGIGRRGRNVSGESGTGDAEAVTQALAGCDAVVQATYRVPVQHHVCLETHGAVVDPRADEVIVYHSSQHVTGSGSRDFAPHLDRPGDQVHTISQHVGGGFGSKFGAGLEGRVACEVALATGRPVHLMLTREDEFLMAGNRSGSVQRMTGGASSDGRLLALQVDADRLGGVGSGALPTPPYIYAVESTHAVVRSVHTATDSSRAMRAPGHPQASFAMETLVDELAYAVGIDPLTFRKKNLVDPVYHRQLDRVAAEIGWEAHPNQRAPGSPSDRPCIGIGFGVSTWGSGNRPDTVVEVRIEPDGAITASTAVQDIGQGARTLVAAIVAEELGLAAHEVTARIGDSRLPPAVYSGGSITTGSIGPSLKDGAHKARVALEERIAPLLEAEPGQLVWRDRRVFVADDPSRALSWSQACAALGSEPLVVNGTFQPHLKAEGVHGAQAAKVSVDPLTGRVQVLRMVCIQDQGLPLNRMALRSQINGGMIQALSFALLEERVHDPELGLLLTGDLDAYRIAGSLEMPELVALIDDDDTRPAVMGMAEAPVIPGHAAIGNAIFNACGLRLREMPFTPDKVLMGLAGES